jgi:hypothetical protein
MRQFAALKTPDVIDWKKQNGLDLRGTTTLPLDEEGMSRKFFDLACRRVSRAEARALLHDIFEKSS